MVVQSKEQPLSTGGTDRNTHSAPKMKSRREVNDMIAKETMDEISKFELSNGLHYQVPSLNLQSINLEQHQQQYEQQQQQHQQQPKKEQQGTGRNTPSSSFRAYSASSKGITHINAPLPIISITTTPPTTRNHGNDSVIMPLQFSDEGQSQEEPQPSSQQNNSSLETAINPASAFVDPKIIPFIASTNVDIESAQGYASSRTDNAPNTKRDKPKQFVKYFRKTKEFGWNDPAIVQMDEEIAARAYQEKLIAKQIRDQQEKEAIAERREELRQNFRSKLQQNFVNAVTRCEPHAIKKLAQLQADPTLHLASYASNRPGSAASKRSTAPFDGQRDVPMRPQSVAAGMPPRALSSRASSHASSKSGISMPDLSSLHSLHNGPVSVSQRRQFGTRSSSVPPARPHSAAPSSHNSNGSQYPAPSRMSNCSNRSGASSSASTTRPRSYSSSSGHYRPRPPVAFNAGLGNPNPNATVLAHRLFSMTQQQQQTQQQKQYNLMKPADTLLNMKENNPDQYDEDLKKSSKQKAQQSLGELEEIDIFEMKLKGLLR